MVADNPDEKISLKMFHSNLQAPSGAVKRNEGSLSTIPTFTRVTKQTIQEAFQQIRLDIRTILANTRKAAT